MSLIHVVAVVLTLTASAHAQILDSTNGTPHGSLSPGALSADGRLLHPLSARDSWFNAPGLIDTADGRILALHDGLRSTLWKFHPDSNP